MARQNDGVDDRVESTVPFRWDLVTPDRLGSLLDGTTDPNLWFADSLIGCASKVIARSGGGDPYFVGRSLDSMFDLLGGAFAGLATAPGLHRLPFSFERPAVEVTARNWATRPLAPAEIGTARDLLSAVGLAPQALVRRTSPAAFVDVAARGRTFTELFTLLRDWIAEERVPWDVARTKIRFVGVTSRTKTSPNTFRWQQHLDWTSRLPARAIVNVSLDPTVWSYLANSQVKLTRSYRPDRWLAAADGPARDERTRQALAEAVALDRYGRTPTARRLMAAGLDGEPALDQAWLRTLQADLTH